MRIRDIRVLHQLQFKGGAENSADLTVANEMTIAVTENTRRDLNSLVSDVVNDGTLDSSIKTVTLSVAANGSANEDETESNPDPIVMEPQYGDSGGDSFNLSNLVMLMMLIIIKLHNMLVRQCHIQGAKKVIFSLLLLFSASSPFSVAHAAENCSDEFYIDETLPSGARWDMCWEHRLREGISFNAVYFTPKGGTRRMVFNQAAIAQIHVPYDDNGTRFHDLSDLGIGGQNLLDLNPDECPSGTIYPVSYVFENQSFTKNGLCKQVQQENIGFKSGTNSEKSYYLSLFNVSPVGAYYYIPTWKFFDDGTIEPWMGATGALQRFGAEENRGWRMGDNRVGIAHIHNYFWKLDFDINKTHLDDVVEEVNFVLSNGKRSRQTTQFDTEAARQVNPSTMRHWRISDQNTKNSNGHNISYDILLNETGHQDIGPAIEPFTVNDFYVTKQRNQEKFASHNTSGARNLAEFVNGENLAGDDIVIWAGVTFYHMPRSEDAPHMDVHWSNLRIVPRDLTANNVLNNSIQTNSAPQVTGIPNQSNQLNISVSLNVQATDVDGDSLIYSASGLPTGLSINSNTGQILGTPNQSGNFPVEVNVNDGQTTSSTQFTWSIDSDDNNDNSGDSGGGSLSLFVLLFLSLLVLAKNRSRIRCYV